MDDRRFDELSRRVGALALPRLPRRGVLGVLGSASLAAALGVAMEPQPAAAAKCKDEGKKCDKKKCKKKDKKCCCKDLKCKNGRCKAKGPTCPIEASFDKQWNSFDGGDSFNTPWGIATDQDGNVYVTDRENERVLVFNPNGTTLLGSFGDLGQGSNDFQDPGGIGVNQNSNGNNRIFVADPSQSENDDRIRRFDGNLSGDFDRLDSLGNDTGENPIFPFGVAIDPDDRVWVVNRDNPGQVFLFNRDSGHVATFTPSFTSPGDDVLDDPEGIAVFENDDGDDFVFVADTGNNRVVKFRYVSNDEEDGLEYVTEVGRADGNFGDGNKEFRQPTGLAVDDCGNVWVADRGNNRIQGFDRNLEERIESIENSNFDEPTGVALSPDGDTLYVASSGNDRIVMFDLS